MCITVDGKLVSWSHFDQHPFKHICVKLGISGLKHGSLGTRFQQMSILMISGIKCPKWLYSWCTAYVLISFVIDYAFGYILAIGPTMVFLKCKLSCNHWASVGCYYMSLWHHRIGIGFASRGQPTLSVLARQWSTGQPIGCCRPLLAVTQPASTSLC